MGPINEISRFSRDPHQRLEQIVKAAKGSPEGLFACILKRGGVGDSSISPKNIQRVTDLMEDFLDAHTQDFNNSDLDSLKNIKEIFLRIQPLSRNREDVENHISRINCITSLVDTIASNIETMEQREVKEVLSYFPDYVQDLIFEYNPEQRKEIDLPPLSDKNKKMESLGGKYGTPRKMDEEDRNHLANILEQASVEERRFFFIGFLTEGTKYLKPDPDKRLTPALSAKIKAVIKCLPKDLDAIELTLFGDDNPIATQILRYVIKKFNKINSFNLIDSELDGFYFKIIMEREFDEIGIKNCKFIAMGESAFPIFIKHLDKQKSPLKNLDLRGTVIPASSRDTITQSHKLKGVAVLYDNN